MQRFGLFSHFLLLFFTCGESAFAQGKVILIAHLFPAGSVRAVSEKLKGDIWKKGEAITSDQLSILIESFTTGINLRDEHFWKYLKYTQYPTVTVKELKGEKGKGQAKLEINGVKKPIDFEYEETETLLKAKFKLKTTDFDLKVATFLGISTEEEVSAEVSMPFQVKP